MKSLIALLVCLVSIAAISQPTVESNAKKLKAIEERRKELRIYEISDSLDKIQKSQNVDMNELSKSVGASAEEKEFSSQAFQGAKDQHIEGSAPAESGYDVHNTWLGKVGEDMAGHSEFIIIGLGIIIAIKLFSKRRN